MKEPLEETIRRTQSREDLNPAMTVDVMTLFPEMIDRVMHESIIGRAMAKGLVRIRTVNIRDFASGRSRRTDDYPYGGGKGLVMLAEPLFQCHQALCGGERVHTVLMSAQGAPFTQKTARRLLEKKHIILVCGHYEGVDERFIRTCVDEEISMGDFVLTGGEIPAMAITDCVCRMVPGVLSEEVCFTDESHWSGLLEYPQYTRPEIWHEQEVPEVLRGGNHAQIHVWERRQALARTLMRRPDLLQTADLTREERALLEELYLRLRQGEIPQTK